MCDFTLECKAKTVSFDRKFKDNLALWLFLEFLEAGVKFGWGEVGWVVSEGEDGLATVAIFAAAKACATFDHVAAAAYGADDLLPPGDARGAGLLLGGLA